MPLKLDKMLPRRAAILSKQVSSEMGPAKAFVVFKEEASVAAALALNMKEVDGHHIRVDKAGRSSTENASAGPQKEYDRSSSIFLGNLPFDVTDEEVIQLFNDNSDGMTSVQAVRIIRDPATNIGKGFGYVLFSDKNAASMALAKEGLTIRKRPLRITRVTKPKPKAKPVNPEASSYSGALGAEGRLSRKRGEVRSTAPAASWQGVRTKGVSKTAKTAGLAKASIQAPSQGRKKQPATSGSEGRKIKRPAVAARKARSLGLAAPAAAKRKQKGSKKKS